MDLGSPLPAFNFLPLSGPKMNSSIKTLLVDSGIPDLEVRPTYVRSSHKITIQCHAEGVLIVRLAPVVCLSPPRTRSVPANLGKCEKPPAHRQRSTSDADLRVYITPFTMELEHVAVSGSTVTVWPEAIGKSLASCAAQTGLWHLQISASNEGGVKIAQSELPSSPEMSVSVDSFMDHIVPHRNFLSEEQQLVFALKNTERIAAVSAVLMASQNKQKEDAIMEDAPHVEAPLPLLLSTDDPCILCQERVASVIVATCNHRVICDHCCYGPGAEKTNILAKLLKGTGLKCPLCRCHGTQKQCPTCNIFFLSDITRSADQNCSKCASSYSRRSTLTQPS